MRWAKKVGNVFLERAVSFEQSGGCQTIASLARRVKASGSTLRNFIPFAYQVHFSFEDL
jgi:hypothetical protein